MKTVNPQIYDAHQALITRNIKKTRPALAGWLRWLEHQKVHTPKVHGFNSPPGHIPKLQFRSLVKVHVGGN